MKAFCSKVLIIAAVLLILTGCSDDLTKSENESIFPRIEYSNCAACYECLDDFQCPKDAIRIDEERHTVYIDQNRCIRCMDCVNQFHCRYDAIKLTEDIIPPASPQEFSATSDSIGMLKIEFFAPGDDSLTGFAYAYKLDMKDSQNNQLAEDFVTPIPQPPGSLESWTFENLPENEVVTIQITVEDEAGHSAQTPQTAVEILGEYIDTQAPAAIDDLLAASDEYSINLSWTAPSDPDPRANVFSYIIKKHSEEINEANWQNAEVIEQAITPAAPGITENLLLDFAAPSGELFFAVRSTDAAGNISNISNNANGNATGDITAPSPITDLAAGDPGNTSIPISWTSVGDNLTEGTATSYIIKYDTQEITSSTWDNAMIFDQQIIPLEAGNIENITVTDLTPETEYYFAVRALDEVNNISDISNSASATTTETADVIPPSSITDLTASIADEMITLQWTATGDDGNEGTAALYDIRYFDQEINDSNWQSAQQLTNIPNPSIAGTNEELTIDYLQHGITWYFAIIASDEEQNTSPVSNNAQAIIPLDTTPPATITDLNADVVEEEIILTWTAPGDDENTGTAHSYDLRMAEFEINETNWDTANMLTTETPQTAGSEETITIPDLDPGITYYFAIKATDDNMNTSQISNVCDAMIEIDIDETPPSAITDLEVFEGQYTYGSRITIEWTAPGDDGDEGTATAYEIRYSQSPITAENWNSAQMFDDPPDPDPAGSSESATITGLEQGVIYYFAVIAIDEADNSGEVSNSPAGKCCYQILTSQCRDCNNCINDCDVNAIYDAGPYKLIDPDICVGCGDCSCPFNAIRRWVIAY